MHTLVSLASSAKFTPTALVFECNSESHLTRLLIDHEHTFAAWAYLLHKESFIIMCSTKKIEIPADPAMVRELRAQEMVMPKEGTPSKLLWMTHTHVSPVLLQIQADLMENPRKAGVTRLSDDLQIIMSDECKVLNPGHSMSEATRWRRPQFWHPDDLDSFHRLIREEGEREFEFTWRSFDPDFGIHDQRAGNWLEFTTHYKLFRDDFDGEAYQLCLNKGMRHIAVP